MSHLNLRPDIPGYYYGLRKYLPDGTRDEAWPAYNAQSASDEDRAGRLTTEQRGIILERFGVGGDPASRTPGKGKLLAEKIIGMHARRLGWGDEP
jgi:hypothetical protein